MTDTAEPVELVEDNDVMVPMRDGVRLRADVFRPASGGGYVSDEAPVEPLVDSLRAGMNLIVAVEVFDRSQRFTLTGSSRAIETALTGCGG